MSVERTDEEVAWLPTTPHELHALGPLTVITAARVVGVGRTQLNENINAGEMPTRHVLGIVKIEPLVAWAARQGGSRETLLAVARALLQGKSVDEIVRLVQELIEAQPPPVRKRRGVKKAVTP